MIRAKILNLPSIDDVESNVEEVPMIPNATSSNKTTNLCSITIEGENSVNMRKKSKGTFHHIFFLHIFLISFNFRKN